MVETHVVETYVVEYSDLVLAQVQGSAPCCEQRPTGTLVCLVQHEACVAVRGATLPLLLLPLRQARLAQPHSAALALRPQLHVTLVTHRAVALECDLLHGDTEWVATCL